MLMGTLAGKNAFVTGTSQGIGAAISKALIEAGCNIAMHYFHSDVVPQKLKKLAEAKNQKAICLQADLTNEKEAARCVKEGAAFLGSIDVLINNSGSLVQRKYLPEVDNKYWQILLDINLTTMMMVTREALPFLNKSEGASVVNMASLAGRGGGHFGSLVYSTAKGAVVSWSRTLARELASQGIRVNAVAPGFIEGTNFHKTHTTRESAINTIKNIPLGRSGCPDDVARAVVFLASEYDGFITGETLDINGGVYCA
jgi:3-oxoacyl-[acyl-carrier protein] reductase